MHICHWKNILLMTYTKPQKKHFKFNIIFLGQFGDKKEQKNISIVIASNQNIRTFSFRVPETTSLWKK